MSIIKIIIVINGRIALFWRDERRVETPSAEF
jgi:hypothetical protein